MAPFNLELLESKLRFKTDFGSVTQKDILSAALYPKVYKEYRWVAWNTRSNSCKLI